MAKDIIFNRWKANNPPCVMPDGTFMSYLSLRPHFEVLVQSKKSPKHYVLGLILAQEKRDGVWLYHVETKTEIDWRQPNDFKHPK